MAAQRTVLDLRREESEESDEDKKLEKMYCTSDEYHEITCSPCSKEKRNVAATKYCVNCANYLCQMCLKQHDRFEMMKSHSVVNATAAKEAEDELPIQRCYKHHGKLLDMYCRDHDEACCAVCAAVDHGTCKGTHNLLDVVKDSKGNKQECEDIFNRINNLQMDIDKVKLARIRKHETFNWEKLEIIRQVRSIRKMVDKRFDDLENKLKKHMDKETLVEEAANETDAQKLDNAEIVLKDQKEALERLGKTGNAASIFVQTRIANKSIAETEELQRLSESISVRNMYFLCNLKLNTLLEDVTTLGEIVQDVPTCSAELHRIVNVRASNENSVSTISGICSLDDGSMLISDRQNRSLKRLDENYDIAEHLELSDQPYDICVMDSQTVAVSLPKVKEIQLVSTENAIKVTATFSVGDACRGIAYSEGMLYIACGGWKVFKEGPGHVEVYTTSGVFQRRFEEHLSQPGHISFAGSRLYVADSNNGLVIMDTNGDVRNSFTHRYMHNPLAVCAGPGNQLFLGGWSSHNVMLVTNDAKLLLTLLTVKNGVKDLHTLFYDDLRSRLIYTMRDADKMKIFNLDYKV